jgi:O-antigen/teichoic acid export membrane protein
MTKRGTVSQILINLGSGWLASAIQMAISLALVPFLLLHLGKEGYGLIGLLGVITSLTAVADLGLRMALGRELAEYVTIRDKQAFSEIASTAFSTYLALAIVLSSILFYTAPWLVETLKIPESLQPVALNLLRIYGVCSIILSFVIPVFSAGLASHHRYDVINGIQITGGILTSGLLFLMISVCDNPLYGWMLVVMVMGILTTFATFFFFVKILGCNPIHPKSIRISRLRSLLNLGGKMYALQLTSILAERSDPLIISYFLGPAGVAIYQSGQKLSQSLRPVVLTLVNQIDPIATQSHVLKRQDQQQKLLIYGTKFTLLIGSFVAAGIISLAYPFCKLWLGTALGNDALIVAKVMTLWACVDLLTYAAGSQFPILLGMKKLKFLIWTQLPTAVLNIALSIYFVGFTSMGMESVLYSTIIINLIRRPILMRHTAHACGITSLQYFRQAYTRPLICFVITLLSGLALRDIAACWNSLILVSLAISLTWLVTFLIIGLNRDDRILMRSRVTSLLRSNLKHSR